MSHVSTDGPRRHRLTVADYYRMGETGILAPDAVKGHALVLAQAPIVLDDYSAPQPDIALLRPRADYYRSALARPTDVFLVIEVAQSSLRYDRGIKMPLYARHGIPAAWLIDAAKRTLTRHRTPMHGTYTRVDEPALTEPLGIE